MPYKLQRVENEPIIVVDLFGHMDVAVLHAMYQEFNAIHQTIPGHIYRVANFLNVESNFHDILEVIADASSGLPGSNSDPNITVVFVGSDQWAKFLTEAFKQARFGGHTIPIFRSIDDALAAVRVSIAEAAAHSQKKTD